MVHVERVIERDSALLEACNNISVGMETDMEVARNSLKLNVASHSAALVFFQLLSDSVVKILAMRLLFLPGFSGENAAVLAESVLVHLSVVVGDVLA